jgi:hypothetical protein
MIHQYMCLFIGQYLTSPTSGDQSGLSTAGIACLIIGLLSIIFVVSLVVYWQFGDWLVLNVKSLVSQLYTKNKISTKDNQILDKKMTLGYDNAMMLWLSQGTEDIIHTDILSFTCIGGVMVTVLASNAVDRGFEPRLVQSKDYKKKTGWLGIIIMFRLGRNVCPRAVVSVSWH